MTTLVPGGAVANCPRCDGAFFGNTKKQAEDLVRRHLVLNDPADELHVGALEEWDDEGSS